MENNGINGNNGTESAVKENAWDGKKSTDFTGKRDSYFSPTL